MDEFTRIEADAHSGAMGYNNLPEPTQAQKIAGNYKVGRTALHGMAIAIEQPRGSFRSGVSADGRPWQNRMSAHYGYLVGTTGNDGDGLDVFIGYFPESTFAYVINQVNQKTGAFDEHKIMLGFPDVQSASSAYLESYDRGWQGLSEIIPVSIPQLKWWARHGNHTKPISAAALPVLGYEIMNKVIWDGESPVGMTFDSLLYDIRRYDDDGLMYDPVSVVDILDDADGAYIFDALVTPCARLERTMQIMQSFMDRTNGTVKPVAMQITEPFKQRGSANVAVVYELSDGQTLSIFFHNPDVTPQKITPTDDLISWKWLLNKKDVTIVAAPERGVDLNVREVANRIMRLAERNSATFQRANAKRAERMQAIEALKAVISAKEATLARLQRELEVKKLEKESMLSAPATANAAAPVPELATELTSEPVAAPDPEPVATVTPQSESVVEPLSGETTSVAQEIVEGPGVIDAPAESSPAQLEAPVLMPDSVIPIGDLGSADRAVTTDDPTAEVMPEPVEPVAEIEPLTSEIGVTSAANGASEINLTGQELGIFPDTAEGDKQLRAVTNDYLMSIKGDWVDCPSLQGLVEIRRAGIKKVLSGSGDTRKLKIIPAIKALIGRSEKLGSKTPYNEATDKSAVAYHIMRASLALDGQPLAVRFVVKEDNNGKFHYDHTVHSQDVALDSASEKEKSPDFSGLQSTTASDGGGTDPSRLVSSQLEINNNLLDAAGQDDGGVAEVLNLFIEGEQEPVTLADEDGATGAATTIGAFPLDASQAEGDVSESPDDA